MPELAPVIHHPPDVNRANEGLMRKHSLASPDDPIPLLHEVFGDGAEQR